MKKVPLVIYLFLMVVLTNCEQQTGPAGKQSLMKLVPEEAGENCEAGGFLIATGIDQNSNGILDDLEIQNTEYICNGTNGINGTDGYISLVQMSAEPPGDICEKGGYQLTVGLDINNNNVLDSSEILDSRFLCNGTQGLNSLMSIIEEPPGENCLSGGIKLLSGTDNNYNGILDQTEVSTIEYVCNGNQQNQNSEIKGFVQKGPFLNGSSITLYELNSNLIQTGKAYSSQILDNNGNFDFQGIEFSSQYVKLIADGFYFNEIQNENSPAQLTLYALSDLSDKSSLNINILSTLEKSRVEYLVSNGSSFSAAKSQAQSEILQIFEIVKSDILDSELLDIAKTGDDNAILLAISVIVQGYLSVSELSELLANISLDIREDGVLNDQKLGSILINNAKTIKLNEIRQNLENRYASLSLDYEIPEFEKYVNQFLDSTSFIFTGLIEYPATGNYGSNILDKNKTEYAPGDYSMAAILPEGTELKVKIQGTNWAYPITQDWSSWERSDWNSTENSRYFTSLKTGNLDFKLSLLAETQPTEEPQDSTGTPPDTTSNTNYGITIVYVYENAAVDPTWIKEITVK